MRLDEIVQLLLGQVVASSVNFQSAKVVLVKDEPMKELSRKEKKRTGTAEKRHASWKKNTSRVLRVSKGSLAPPLQQKCGREKQSIAAAKSATILLATAAVTNTRQQSERSAGTILVEMERSGSVLLALRA